MKTKLAIIAVTAALISACGQSPSTVPDGTKPLSIPSASKSVTKPSTGQNRLGTKNLTAKDGIMQIVAHDGDKEANEMGGGFTNDTWNYSSTSAKSAFGKEVDWLETDVILNKPSGFLFMQHSKDCKRADGTTVDLMEASLVEINECAELFDDQLKDLGRDGQFMIELKGDQLAGSQMSDGYRDALVKAVFKTLDQQGRVTTEIVTSMDYQALLDLRDLADREGYPIHLAYVIPLFAGGPTHLGILQAKNDGIEYISAAVKDWTNENIDYAQSIGLQTMGWGWDDWWTGGRNPNADNDKGIELCVDFMLTEAINDLQSKDRRCKRRLPSEPPVDPPAGDSKLPPSGNPDFDNLKPCAEGASDMDGKLENYTSGEPCKPGESIWIAVVGKTVMDQKELNDPDFIPAVSYHRVQYLKSLSAQTHTVQGSCGSIKIASWKNSAIFWSRPNTQDLYFRCYAGYYSYTTTFSYKFIRLSQLPNASYYEGSNQTTLAWPTGLVEP